MELFQPEDVRRILHNKFAVIIGGSVQRSIYKDLVLFLQQDRLLQEQELKQKGEHEFLGDKLIEGGRLGEMNNGKNYREVRQYQSEVHLVRFYFVTRCYNKYMQTIIADLTENPTPDVIIMTSCLWDISRYGPYSMQEYHKNLQCFFHHLNQVIPANTLVIWNTSLPVSCNIRGGFLLDYISFMQDTLRLDMVEANFFAAQVTSDYGHDVLDLHYNFRHLQHHRVKDGIHWNATAHRYMSQLMLAHIAAAWHLPRTQRSKFKHPLPPVCSTSNQGHQNGPTQPFPHKFRRKRKQRSISCCPALLNDDPIAPRINHHVAKSKLYGGHHIPSASFSNNFEGRFPNIIASDRGFWMEDRRDIWKGESFACEPPNVTDKLGQHMHAIHDRTSNQYSKTDTWEDWGWSENRCFVEADYHDHSYETPVNQTGWMARTGNFTDNFSWQQNNTWKPSWHLPINNGCNNYNGLGENYNAQPSGPVRRRGGHAFRPYRTKSFPR